MESVEYSSRNLKPVEFPMTTIVEPPPTTTVELSKTTTVDIPKTTTVKLPKTTMTVGAEARSRKLERHQSLEDLRKMYLEYTPKAIKGTFGGTQNPPGDIGRCNAGLEAPCQLKAHDRDCKDVPPLPLVEPVKTFRRNQKFVKLPKATVLLGNESDFERRRSLWSQAPYIGKEHPATASGIEKWVSHHMGEVDKESPSPTHLKSVRDVQVAPEPKITHGKSISQSVKLGNEHNGLTFNKIEGRPSRLSAVVERAIMTIKEEHRVQGAVRPAKIVLEPENEARQSTLHHSYHTTPLTVLDADDELMSSLSDGGSEQPQFSDDGIVGDGRLCFHLFVYII